MQGVSLHLICKVLNFKLIGRAFGYDTKHEPHATYQHRSPAGTLLRPAHVPILRGRPSSNGRFFEWTCKCPGMCSLAIRKHLYHISIRL